jgi:G3E family GTPase
MATELDRLLASISPEKTIAETFNRANHAINTFPVSRGQITEWNEFMHFMSEFARHLDFHILRLRGPVAISSDQYWQQCAAPALNGVYGSSGTKAAFEMARTGNGGGLYAVLMAVSMHVAEDYAKREIAAKVGTHLQRLSAQQQLDACSEYLSKYGSLLPSELTEASAARIRADFQKVLQRHPWLLKKTHEVGR